ncbi:glycosyltransferase family 2 protein [Isoptericola sp. NEAU-Y5]|uniref:Glycosyltransferase family 2 protein n=1 Tax=Isoptericola luteus TaxID=2879484 RepID=A0ABS7ZEV3_9MICO|nr:glycosyltransferase family 2 protein [Isoptericola sp. NEAU-Y5]MCA5893002.1 glycosyltransferase family 2 protein [Isoptericola sp. NEAU-Y5]
MDRLKIVVVTYGRSDLVTRCLSSVLLSIPEKTTIHVVDNSSPDDTADVVATRFPEVALHRRTSNDGFAAANNAVLAEITAPYVLLLNPDTEIGPGLLDHLLDAMDEHMDVGMVGCRLVTADGSLDHAAKRHIPSPWTAVRYFALKVVGRTGSHYTAPDVGEYDVAEVEAVNGAFMLVRAEAIREVGLLDERFWMYAEDLDWCVRMRAAGWSIVYDGRVTATHLKGGSSGTARPLRLNYHFHRSMVLFYLKHQRRSPLVDACVVTGIWLRFALSSTASALTRAFARSGGARPRAVEPAHE